jgi:iron(III) transport system ATP-binding protein
MNIQINDLSKGFGPVKALDGIDLQIEDGRFTTILGPSGCGKTTLLRCLAGLELPDRGEIIAGERYFFSKSKKVNLPSHRRRLGMVFQDFALWPHLSIFENVAFSLKATGVRDDLEARVRSALTMVHLTGMEKRYPGQLSGGQQQRVAFARAVVNRSEAILFDEPLSALDAKLRDEMRFELKALVRELGLTAIYVTHDQGEALSVSDRIVVLNEGRVVQNDTPQSIYYHPADPFIGGFIGKSNWLEEGRPRMFRPENIRWNPGEGRCRFEGRITDCSFQGDQYEIHVRTSFGRTWVLYSGEAKSMGEAIVFYVDHEAILEF